MAFAPVKSAVGLAATSSVSPAFGSPTTAGNLVILAFSADDYNGTPDTGWTQSAEMEQQTFHGGYFWWCISTGQTTMPSYTIGSATNSSWVLAEFSGNDAAPYDISQGQLAASSSDNYTTDIIVPSTGERLLVAMIGGSSNIDLSGAYSAWLNSFTAIDDSGNPGANQTCVGLAYRIVTGNGSTSFSTGATYPTTVQSRSGLIISFKEATAASINITPPQGNQVLSPTAPTAPVNTYMQPSADDTDGGWTDQVGGTSLFAAIDEFTIDDADFIQSLVSPVNDLSKIKLSTPSGGMGQPFQVSYRYKKSGTAPIDLRVRLLQGLTVIATWTHSDISGSFLTATQTLSGGEFATITDFGDLYIEFMANAA